MRIFTLIILFWGAVCATAYAAPSAKDFAELPTIYDAAVSPDKTRLAAFINFKGSYGVQVINIDGSKSSDKPQIILLGKGINPQWIKWVNNGRVLASVRQNDKIGLTPVTTGFIFTLDTDKMKGKVLIESPRGKARQFNNVIIDFLEDDPDHILMAFDDDSKFEPAPQLVNVETGFAKRLRRGTEFISEWTTDDTGTVRVGQGVKYGLGGKAEDYLTIKDSDSDNWNLADKFPGLDAGVPIFGFTSNRDELIIGDYKSKDTLGVYVYDLKKRAVTRKIFHDDNYDAKSVVFSADGGEVIGVKFDSETEEIALLGGNGTIMDRMRALYPGYRVDFVDQSTDKEVILFKTSSGYDAGYLMMIKRGDAEPTQLVAIRPALPSDDMGYAFPVKYTARDGTKIPAYITLPPSVTDTSEIKNLPFIILPHGGPYARTVDRFDYFAQFFATRGYAVLQMNFRGSAGYGKAYEEAGQKNWEVMQADVEDGTRWLLKKGYADPDKTCIVGWSYGGYAALMGAVKTPELYNCAVSIAGVTDIGDLVNDMKEYRGGRYAAKNSILSGFDGKDSVKDNSPLKRVDEIKVPVFLAHGDMDTRVHYGQFKRMKKALEKSGKDVTALGFKKEDHFISKQENREEMLIALEKFLEGANGKSPYMQ